MHLSKRVIEMGWKQDESGTGEGVLTLVKLDKNPIQVSSNILFWYVLAEIHLDFDS